jgi:hypothetical protein
MVRKWYSAHESTVSNGERELEHAAACGIDVAYPLDAVRSHPVAAPILS